MPRRRRAAEGGPCAEYNFHAMAHASLVVSLVAAIAAVLAWRVMDGQRRAADCPILALATLDEGDS